MLFLFEGNLGFWQIVHWLPPEMHSAEDTLFFFFFNANPIKKGVDSIYRASHGMSGKFILQG